MKTNKLKSERIRLGKGLFALAVIWSKSNLTQSEREEQIKTAPRRRKTLDGKTGIRYLREQVDAVAKQIADERQARKAKRQRNGYPACITRSQPVRLPSGPLNERLRVRVALDVMAAFRGHYRIDPSAGSESMRLTANPSEVGIQQSRSQDWDYYSRATKRPKLVIRQTVTVPRAWWSRVQARNLAIVDGMLTLDAQQAEGAPTGIELFAAVWLVQGRGYDISAQHGFIARDTLTGESYHANTAKQALTGLSRKLAGRKLSAALDDALAKHGIEGLVQQHPGITVTLQDARITGSCEYGIRSFCERSGLPYDAGQAPLADVYAAYQGYPLPEARRAILHALRRQKHAVLRAA